MFRPLLITFCIVLVPSLCLTQDQITASPTASGVADPFLQGKYPSAVTLTGTANRTVGSKHETATVVLKTKSDGSFSENWEFPSEQPSFAAGPLLGTGRDCSHDAPSRSIVMSVVACQGTTPWFAPWMAASSSFTSVLSIGPATPDLASGSNLQTRAVRLATTSSNGKNPRQQTLAKAVQADSTVTVYCDPTTGLVAKYEYRAPTEFGFSRIDITVEYSDYRDEGGYMLPHHLVRSIQHTVETDLKLTAVTIDAL